MPSPDVDTIKSMLVVLEHTLTVLDRPVPRQHS